MTKSFKIAKDVLILDHKKIYKTHSSANFFNRYAVKTDLAVHRQHIDDQFEAVSYVDCSRIEL